jgi:glycosyltransferase involved in cell wall biosynthesis
LNSNAVSYLNNQMACPVRIALVTGGLTLGGATTFLCNFAGELVRRGIPAQILSFEKENPLASDFARLNIPLLCQDERNVIFEDRMQSVLRQLSEFRPTVVVSTLSATSFEVLRYLPPGVFRVGMAQNDDCDVYALVRTYASQLDLMAAVSKRIKETLAGMSEFANIPVGYLPYGVPMPQEKGADMFADGAPLRILYLGRLDQAQKRVRLFPEIFQCLRSSGIAFHWTIAGDGPEKTFLEASMRSPSPHQTVLFTGTIDYASVPKLLSEHDVFLLASHCEGLPLTILEAMGSGLVPVVSDVASGIPELIDDSCGMRVGLQDVPGYAKAVIWLHEHREAAKKLSKNARERVRNEFSIAAMTDRWLAVLPGSISSPTLWQNAPHIKSPLTAQNSFLFSPAGRMLRRLKFATRRSILK